MIDELRAEHQKNLYDTNDLEMYREDDDWRFPRSFSFAGRRCCGKPGCMKDWFCPVESGGAEAAVEKTVEYQLSKFRGAERLLCGTQRCS